MEKVKNHFMHRYKVSSDSSYEVHLVEPNSFPMLKKRSFSKTLQNLTPMQKSEQASEVKKENTSIYKLDANPGFISDVIEVPTLLAQKRFRSMTKLVSSIPKKKNKKGLSASVIGTCFKGGPVVVQEVPEKKSPVPVKPLRLFKKPKTVPLIEIRDQLFLEFLEKIRLSNGIGLGEHGLKYFKFYIGPGNNSGLVKRVLKKRWWWVCTDSMQEAQFVWTSIKQAKILNTLPNSTNTDFHITEKYRSRIPKKQRQQALEESANYGFNLVLLSSHFNLLEKNGTEIDNTQIKVYNRLNNNNQLCSKKRLFKNLKKLCSSCCMDIFSIVPLTFHISKFAKDPVFEKFQEEFIAREKESLGNMWIIKPGESTNRGRGIKVTSSLSEIREIVCYPSYHTHIIQKYIENPLLINNRKFDIRCYGLLTSMNGMLQGYYYPEGYIRTASAEYSLENHSKYIHLTNDAIQKFSENYGKYESGNKLSYSDLDSYLKHKKFKRSFFEDIEPQIKDIVAHTFQAVHTKIDSQRKEHCFEMFGYDFMVDSDGKVWLIEVNTNPCLEESCPLLSRLLSEVIDNSIRIAVDPLFPPPHSRSKNLLNWMGEAGVNNKYHLVFSESEIARRSVLIH